MDWKTRKVYMKIICKIKLSILKFKIINNKLAILTKSIWIKIIFYK